jgi:hypothetical protein
MECFTSQESWSSLIWYGSCFEPERAERKSITRAALSKDAALFLLLGDYMSKTSFLLILIALLLALNLAATVLTSSTVPVKENLTQAFPKDDTPVTAENSTPVSDEERNLEFDDFSLPGSISLCGEALPLESRHVLEMLDREFTISVWDRAQVLMWLKRAGRYFPYIEEKLAEAGMPADLKYVAVAESALLVDVRSRKRAVGLWQFMAHTGRRYGLRKNYTIDERKDFEQSTEAAVKYLEHLYDKFGNWALALAAYNCGEALLSREMKKQKVKDFYRLRLPAETERYIFRIAAAKIIMENPELYGFKLNAEQTYRPMLYDKVEISLRRQLKLTDLAVVMDTDYKTLRELNPQIRRYYLSKGNHTIKVPPGYGPRVALALKSFGDNTSRDWEEISESHYLVRRGDTLGRISQRTGISIATLRDLNGIQGSTIWAGQKLRLAP